MWNLNGLPATLMRLMCNDSSILTVVYFKEWKDACRKMPAVVILYMSRIMSFNFRKWSAFVFEVFHQYLGMTMIKKDRRIPFTVCSSCTHSFAIEVLQYVFLCSRNLISVAACFLSPLFLYVVMGILTGYWYCNFLFCFVVYKFKTVVPQPNPGIEHTWCNSSRLVASGVLEVEHIKYLDLTEGTCGEVWESLI